MYLQARILLNTGKRIPSDVLRRVAPKPGILEVKRAESSGPARRTSAFDPQMVARFYDPVPPNAKRVGLVFPPLYDPTIVSADHRGIVIAGFEWVQFDDKLRGMVRQAWWLQSTASLGGTPAP